MLGFFLVVFLILGVAGVLFWRWRGRVAEEITEGAGIERADFQQHEPEFLAGMSEARFREVYRRVHEPRFPGYVLGILATFFATLPVSFGLLSAFLWIAEKFGMMPEQVEVADRLLIRDGTLRFFRDTPPEAALYYIRDVAGFYYFFGVLFIWLLTVAFFTRRYHSRRPGYLRDELSRARE